jgi:hypothetical protein
VTSGRARIVVPDAPPSVAVRHRNPSVEPPDFLVPYVQPVRRNGVIDDWFLTTDAIAFGEPGVAVTFDAWRAEWERAWRIDPIPDLVKLLDAGAEFGIACPILTDVIADMARAVEVPGHDDGVAVVGVEVVRSCSIEMGAIGDAVRTDGSQGFGFIDASVDRQVTGLARAWSPRSGREVVAADEHISVEMHPVDGLCVTVLDSSGPRRLRHVDSVEHVADRIRVAAMDGGHGSTVVDLDLAHARPLGWLMPHASRWRVRLVPEVVVWAQTFSAFEQAANVAHALGKSVRIGCRMPVKPLA